MESNRTRKTAPCPVCDGETALFFRTRDLNRRLSGEIFAYHRCRSCRLVFLDPVPCDLASYYDEDYHGALPSLSQLIAAAKGVEGYKLELVRRFVRQGRLLEIGPGLGGFACLAKEAGYEVEAIEMDEKCCSFLSNVVGVRTICSHSPASVLSTEGPYDIVALWHVFEHLPDAFGTLAAASRRLKPGGVVVIAAPNPDGLQFRLLRHRWAHVDAPRHLFLVPLRLLLQRAQAHGLEPVLCTMTDEGGIGWNSFGWRESLANLVGGRALRPLARRAGTALTYALAPLERTGRRGATYTVVLRKVSAV
jgi:2-polyprenyl-3-methyl-5-hydroxy-6-metoxy-1,4-benzoquinol methylase